MLVVRSSQHGLRSLLVVFSHSHRLRSLLTAAAALLACALVATPLALALAGRDQPRAHGAVVGGAVASEGQYPSAAFVLDVRGKLVGSCSGTVIAPSLVLTAGHCAENIQTGVVNPHGGYHVVTSQVDLAATQPGQVSRVIGVIPYPGYERRRDPGDAALLVLEKPVAASPMPLVKLGQSNLYGAGTTATITGWGLTSTIHPKVSKRLRYASTVVQPARWCKRHIRPFFPRWEICTIDSAHFTASGCFGDSGGPLMVPRTATGELVEVGIVALGNVRCSPRYPSVYTRVEALSGWLRSWIAAYSTAVVRAPVLTSPPVVG
ncbi:MAG TPA: serine protease [Solirubrobacteraceae bacterium]|nr:serine protease [Solirubrobacteraceae bacterium]